MRRIYTASGLAEAYLLKDFLATHGVEALVFNEHSAGAVGEIPCNETLPQLWIRDERQFARARELVLAYEGPPDFREPTSCPSCGEQNPANFDICWQCGASLTG